MKSLKWKIVLMYIVLVAFIMTACGAYILYSVQKNEYENVRREMEYLTERIVDAMEAADYSDCEPEAFFADLVAAWVLESSESESMDGERLVYLMDDRGATLYCRGEDLTEEERASRLLTGLIYGTGTPELYVHTDSWGQSVADWAVSFQLDGGRYIVLVRQSMKGVQSSLYNTAYTIVVACCIGIATAGILGFFIAAGITRPLLKLTKKTQKLAAGELEIQPKEEEPEEDELDLLNHNFDNMAQALSSIIFELNSEKNKLNAIFQYMTDGLLMYNTEGVLMQWNPAAIQLLGEQILKQNMEKTFYPVKAYQVEESSGVYSQLRQAGEGYVNAVFVPFRDETEENAGFIVVLQDVTERQKMESLQKEFVANVSHELRTPVTTVKSYVETLMDEEAIDPPTRQRFLGVIDSEADRMTRLIAELLELSKMDSHRNILPNQPLDLVPIIQECMQKYQIHARKKNQELSYEGPEKEVWVVGNSGQLAQVFRNLLMNAIMYSPEEGKIRVGVISGEDGEWVKAYVQDNGIGIAPVDQKRIFERFFRTDKARSRAMGGTGLGLAIVKEIMELHDGAVWVESELGKGSTFWLSFPKGKGGEPTV